MAEPTLPDLEPWPEEDPPCRNCGTPAVVVLDTPAGCVVFPNDRRMAVCAQHLRNWGFLDDGVTIGLLAEVFPGAARMLGW